jgi:cell division protein FtsB
VKTRAPGNRPRPLAGRLALFSVLALVVLLVLRVLVGDDGYPALSSLGAELASPEADTARLDEQNRLLRQQIHGLRETLHPVERIAREELDFAAPGEVTYLFPADLDEHRQPAAEAAP